MRVVFSLLGLGPVLLAACAPSDPTGTAGPAPVDVTCDAGFFEYLRGEPIEIVDTIISPLQVRVLGSEDFVPRDFDPNRLTFTTSPDGEVSRVFCG
jgi:hypothetical protein